MKNSIETIGGQDFERIEAIRTERGAMANIELTEKVRKVLEVFYSMTRLAAEKIFPQGEKAEAEII